MNPIFITLPLSGLLSIALAIGLGIFLTRKFRLGWRLYWIGAVVFILSQVFHIPFNAYVLPFLREAGIIPTLPEPWALPLTGLVLGLSAGIFEEGARYLMYRFWAKNARSWGKGLLAGAGHGGIEAIIVGLLILWSGLQVIAFSGRDVSGILPPEQIPQVEAQLEAALAMPWYATMLGFVERMFVIPVHIALSVLVLQVFTRRQIRWLFAAIAWHTLLNAVGAVYVMQMYGMYAAVATIGLFSLLSIGIIFALHAPEPEEPAETDQPVTPPPSFAPLPVEESGDRLKDSRYTKS